MATNPQSNIGIMSNAIDRFFLLLDVFANIRLLHEAEHGKPN
jgi:hypothetical protein